MKEDNGLNGMVKFMAKQSGSNCDYKEMMENNDC